VLISAEREQPRGAVVRLKSPEFEWTAQVVWTREMEEELGFLLGMKFLSLSTEDTERLVRLLRKAAAGT
jgi:hypothetical protein